MKALAFAFAGAALAVAAPASAATYFNFTGVAGTSGTFGNDVVRPVGAFTDVFNFSLLSAGTLAGTISSSRSSVATNLDFSTVRVDGPGIDADGLLFDFVAGGPLRAEFQELFGTRLAAGEYTLTVSGTTGSNASYSGDFSFAAVPEPATWGLMILGFGMVGGAMRRRAAKTTVRFA